MGQTDIAETLARNSRIDSRIQNAFDAIDPQWREVDEGEETRRVCYSWGVRYGQVALDVSGSGVTQENHERYRRAIIEAIEGG